MLQGTQHELTGWLNDDQGQLILRMDGGGRWRLECGFLNRWRANRLLGKRVRVRGVRDGFDVLSVNRLEQL